MRHRSEARVDSYSRAGLLAVIGKPHHRNNEGFLLRLNEEYAYTRWCLHNNLDPEDTASAVAYEGDIGWLYLEEKEDHR